MAEVVDLKTLRDKGLVVDRSRHYTRADLEPLDEVVSPKYEIIDGVLYVSPSPHAKLHQLTVGRLHLSLAGWLADNPVGEVFLSPVDLVVSADKTVVPDLVFVRTENLDQVNEAIEVAPDLVVEVLSPSTAWYDRSIKRSLYEEAGVREYWMIDPREQTIERYVLGPGGRFGEPTIKDASQQLASAALEGFVLDVARMFEA